MHLSLTQLKNIPSLAGHFLLVYYTHLSWLYYEIKKLLPKFKPSLTSKEKNLNRTQVEKLDMTARIDGYCIFELFDGQLKPKEVCCSELSKV